MARARRVCPGATRGSAGASSSLVVLTVVAMLVGFVVAAVGAGRLQRARALGEHLPRGRRSRELGPGRRRGPQIARPCRPTSCSSARWRATATSDAIGRGATLALNCTMCHGAQGMSGSDAPNLAGQYPEVVIKQMQDYKTGKRASPIMEAIGKAFPTATSPTSRPTTPICRRRAPRRRTYDETAARAGARRRPAAQHRAVHLVPRRRRPEVRHALARGHAQGAISSPSSRPSRSGARRNDSQAQMRNMARAMTPREIEEVADVLRAQGERRRAPPVALRHACPRRRGSRLNPRRRRTRSGATRRVSARGRSHRACTRARGDRLRAARARAAGSGERRA